MAPTLIETSSFSLILDMPERPSSAIKIDAFILFLIGSELGTERLTWETLDQTFVSLTATRTPRSPGSYYRDPHPLTLAVELPSTPGIPVLRISVNYTDFTPLVSSLRAYANTLRQQK